MLIFVFLNASQDRLVCDACLLEKSGKVLNAEMSIWTAMGLPRARLMFHEDLLAAVWAVSVSSSIAISPYVTVGVSYVISILFIEHVVSDFRKRASPEEQALLEREPNTL